MKYITSDRVVRDILYSIGDNEHENYSVIMRQLVRSYKDLNINVIYPSKNKISKLASDLSIQCPEDCVDVYRVGHLNSDKTVTLFGKTDLFVKDDCNCCNCTDGETDIPPCDNWIFGNTIYGELYSHRTDYHENGKWDYDSVKNKIYFTSGFAVYEGVDIVYSYRSSNEDFNEISEEYYEAIRHHVLWNYFQARDIRKAEYFRSMLRISIANLSKNKNIGISDEDIIAGWIVNKNTP